MKAILKKLKQRRKESYYQKNVGKVFDYSPEGIFSSYRRNKVKKKALKLNDSFGRQFHIVPASDQQDKAIIVDNVYMKNYNANVEPSKRIDHHKLLKMAFFSTHSTRVIEMKPKYKKAKNQNS